MGWLRLSVRLAAVARCPRRRRIAFPHLALQLAAQQEELRLLLDGEIFCASAKLSSATAASSRSTVLVSPTRRASSAGVLLGPGERGLQLLVERLPRDASSAMRRSSALRKIVRSASALSSGQV